MVRAAAFVIVVVLSAGVLRADDLTPLGEWEVTVRERKGDPQDAPWTSLTAGHRLIARLGASSGPEVRALKLEATRTFSVEVDELAARFRHSFSFLGDGKVRVKVRVKRPRGAPKVKIARARLVGGGTKAPNKYVTDVPLVLVRGEYVLTVKVRYRRKKSGWWTAVSPPTRPHVVDLLAASEAGTPVLPPPGEPAEPYRTVSEEYEVTAPSGAVLYGIVRRPDPAEHPGLSVPAVISVPGGINPGRLAAWGDEARLLAEMGVAVFCFNAEGRADLVPPDKRSEGTEDMNGPRNQDGLAEIFRHALGRPWVTADNVGIRTQSYGITMGAGCAARHPELPVKFLVDGEGPPSSFVTIHEPYALDDDELNDKHETAYAVIGHYSTTRDPSPGNLAFWADREAIRTIGAFRGRYVRLQAEWDHSQPPQTAADVATFDLPDLGWWQAKHTTDIVNAAVSGGVPWVRVNLPAHGNVVNAVYDHANRPTFLPGELADGPFAVLAVQEMVRTE
ncbi:MAG: hypothetical protein ABFS86_17630 [Planctomycetota bacterium]